MDFFTNQPTPNMTSVTFPKTAQPHPIVYIGQFSIANDLKELFSIDESEEPTLMKILNDYLEELHVVKRQTVITAPVYVVTSNADAGVVISVQEANRSGNVVFNLNRIDGKLVSSKN